MKKAKGSKYRLEVRKSPIHGQGLFAAEDIPWGKKIKEYRGKVISDKEAKKRSAKGAPAIMELGRHPEDRATVRPTAVPRRCH